MRESSKHKDSRARHCTESEVFTDIYNTYHRKVHDAAYHICQCTHISEEIAQEVFVKLWIKKEYIQEIKDIDSWLFMMTRNLSIDHLRRNKLEKLVLENYYFMHANDIYSDEFATKELEKIMMEAVEQLHPQQKRVYQLKRHYGWKREKIAQQLNISENTVRNHMQKALQSVKKYVKEKVV